MIPTPMSCPVLTSPELLLIYFRLFLQYVKISLNSSASMQNDLAKHKRWTRHKITWMKYGTVQALRWDGPNDPFCPPPNLLTAVRYELQLQEESSAVNLNCLGDI